MKPWLPLAVLLASLCSAQTGFARRVELGFDKRFDDSLLLEVVDTDPVRSWERLVKDGIRVLRISPRAEGGSATDSVYSFLPEARSDEVVPRIRKLFEEEDVLGIFLTHKNIFYQTPVDTIIVSPQADRWTLVHELMHALIDRERRNGPLDSESALLNQAADAREDYFELRDRYLLRERFVSAAHRQALVEAFTVYHELQLRFLLDCEIEEILIERYVSGMARSDSPKMLNAEGLERAERYIRSNRKKAIDSLGLVVRGADELRQFLLQDDPSADTAFLERMLGRVSELLRWLDEVGSGAEKGKVTR